MMQHVGGGNAGLRRDIAREVVTGTTVNLSMSSLLSRALEALEGQGFVSASVPVTYNEVDDGVIYLRRWMHSAHDPLGFGSVLVWVTFAVELGAGNIGGSWVCLTASTMASEELPTTQPLSSTTTSATSTSTDAGVPLHSVMLWMSPALSPSVIEARPDAIQTLAVQHIEARVAEYPNALQVKDAQAWAEMVTRALSH